MVDETERRALTLRVHTRFARDHENLGGLGHRRHWLLV